MFVFTPLFIFIIGLGIRAFYLLYNLSWSLPSEWPGGAKLSLVAAELLLKKLPSLPEVPINEALTVIHIDDHGLILLHMFFYELFGKSSLLYAQIFSLSLDASVIFLAIYLGRVFAGKKFGTMMGYAYALYLPQIFVSIQPMWYSALNAGTFGLVALAVYLFRKNDLKPSWWIGYVSIVFLITIIASQFRSTIIFFSFFLAVVSLIFYRKQKRALSLCFFLGGALAIFSNAALNEYISGIPTPTRSNFGHCFWIGVGEFENPYGLTESDASVGVFYRSQTGLNLSLDDHESFENYEKWLKRRAISFIIEHPFLYASMVVRRALKIIFPNYRLQRVADENSYLFNVKKSINDRLAITKSGKLFSLEGIKQLWQMDLAFFFELLVRGFFFFSLPVGACIGLWRFRKHPLLPFYASGLAYGLATLAPLRGPVMNHYSVWTITLPLVIGGYYSLFRRKEMEAMILSRNNGESAS